MKTPYFIVFLSMSLLSPQAHGLPVPGPQPVIDFSSIQKLLEQTEQLVQQYELMKDKFKTDIENMIRHITKPGRFLLNEIHEPLMRVKATIDEFERLRNRTLALGKRIHHHTQGEDLKAYLKNFQDVDYYLYHSCYGPAACTPQERQSLREIFYLSSKAQKLTIDSIYKQTQTEAEYLREDSIRVEKLSQDIEMAEGQLEAQTYANRLLVEMNRQIGRSRQANAMLLGLILSEKQMELDQKAQQKAQQEQLNPIQTKAYTPTGPTIKAW